MNGEGGNALVKRLADSRKMRHHKVSVSAKHGGDERPPIKTIRALAFIQETPAGINAGACYEGRALGL